MSRLLIMKSNITQKFKIGDLVELSKDFQDKNIRLKKGWKVYINDIELSDSKNAELDEIYLCECIDYGFWCSEDFLNA